MLSLNCFTRIAFPAAASVILGVTMVASATAGVAQTSGDMTIVPRVGLIHATGDLGLVPLNENFHGDVGRPGPGLQIGAGLQRVMGNAGWVLEAQVTRSFFARGGSEGWCAPSRTITVCDLILVRGDLSVTITSASIAATAPPMGSLPAYLKAGFGAKRHEVSGKGNGYLRGAWSDTALMVLLGVGVRWRIAGTLVEVELTDSGSFPDFGMERRFTNELSLSLGLPIRFD